MNLTEYLLYDDKVKSMNYLRKMRKHTGLTQKEAAKRLGFSQQALCRYETEKIKPGEDQILHFAKVYGIDILFTSKGIRVLLKPHIFDVPTGQNAD